MRRPAGLFSWIYCGAVLLFLFAPLAIVVVFAFDAGGTATFPLKGFTLKWFDQFFDDEIMVAAARTSILVVVLTMVFAVLLGALCAFALERHRARFSGAFAGAIVLPIVLPPLLLGIALLSFFNRVDFELSLWTVVIGHVLVTLPFVMLTLWARLATLDPSLEEAAATLGASPLQAFRHVTLPLIRSALIGSALLVAALSLDEFVVTFFTIGSDNTLTTVIWGQMRAGVSPVVNAVSALMLAATLVLMFGVRKLIDVRI
jgi:spermidine/putrescine transport system permease protein